MIGSLYSGISGIRANTSAMAVIGDNIANVSTTGFKSSDVSFANIFSAQLGQSDLQTGRGVTLSGIDARWETGSFENTSNPTDMSINGRGLFIVRDDTNGVQYYTRAGKFEFDRDGYLVNQDSLVAQGYNIDTVTGVVGPLGDIVLPAGTSAPRPTDTITMGLNLDADATVGDVFTTNITTFDSLGTPVDLTFTFTNVAPTVVGAASEWDWYASSSDGTVTAPVLATPATLAFNNQGALISPTGAGNDPTITITGLPGADLSIDWTMLDTAGASDGSVTGYVGTSTKSSQSQNGFASGTLQGVAVDEDGIFSGIYSNGNTIAFAQVALANFASLQGLAKQGSNLYAESLASGQPVITIPGSAGVGAIAPSTLEISNVDLAQEFVELITTQRAFQANSKVITTSDEVLAELINIKR
jgi:flagellar hook protein FlgE